MGALIGVLFFAVIYIPAMYYAAKGRTEDCSWDDYDPYDDNHYI